MTKTYYVPIGTNCRVATALRDLELREMSLPFDWVPSASGVVLDCLKTRFEKYCVFGGGIEVAGVNDHLLWHQKGVPKEHLNHYGCAFNHFKDLSPEELVSKFKERCNRFLNLIERCKNGEIDLVFVYANEYDVYFKNFRDVTDRDYEYVKQIEKVLVEQYELKNFKILSLNIDTIRKNTKHIVNANIVWEGSYYDFGCYQISVFEAYRKCLRDVVKSFNAVLAANKNK